MRIGVAGLRGLPGIMGGIEAHAQELYPRLANLEHGLDIEIAMRRPYVSGPTREWRGLRLSPLWATRNKYLETITHTFVAVIVFALLRRRDAVHLHAIGPGLFVPLARLLGLRVLLTHHGQDYNRLKWNRYSRLLLRLGEWAAVSFANEVIVVSEGVTRELQTRFPHRAARISFIPNGISATFSGVDPHHVDTVLSRLDLVAGSYILAVGRLVPEKGFHDLVAAHQQSECPRRLVIVGAADHEDDYARSLLATASDTVCFLGFQDHETLRALYAGAALFVLPSYHEGLPIVALEAIGMSTPTLLSDIPANVELGLGADHYFPAGDVDRLSERLSRSFDGYAVDGRTVFERYDWDKIAQATALVLRQLA